MACLYKELKMRGEELKAGSDIAIVATGTMANVALRAAERSTKSVAVYDLRYIKPLDEAMLDAIGSRFSKVITIEDGAIRGGVGEAITSFLNDNGYNTKVARLGIGDKFIEHGTLEQLHAICGFDKNGIIAKIKELL